MKLPVQAHLRKMFPEIEAQGYPVEEWWCAVSESNLHSAGLNQSFSDKKKKKLGSARKNDKSDFLKHIKEHLGSFAFFFFFFLTTPDQKGYCLDYTHSLMNRSIALYRPKIGSLIHLQHF